MSDDILTAYENVVNRVFEITFDDLVEAYKKLNNAKKRMHDADTAPKRDNAEYDMRLAEKKVKYYEDWLREALPQWRELDADKIIERAKEVARDGGV